MILYTRQGNERWLNEKYIVGVEPSNEYNGFVWIDTVDGKTGAFSPFKPQERNDEAFMGNLTKSTTLNEVLLRIPPISY
jgi:hypothetical protein